MNLFDPALAPFTISLAILFLLLVVEAAGMLMGASVSSMADDAFPAGEAAAEPGEAGDGGALAGLLSWLGVGRVPLLMVLAALFLSFGVIGLCSQSILRAVFGGFAPAWLVGPPAFAAALPCTRWIARGLARLLPKEQSDAVSRDTFIGRIAVVTRGEARSGLPAEAKLRDAKGLAHYLLVEPDERGVTFPAGSEVLLVEKSGAVFRGVLNPSPLLSAATSDVA